MKYCDISIFGTKPLEKLDSQSTLDADDSLTVSSESSTTSRLEECSCLMEDETQKHVRFDMDTVHHHFYEIEPWTEDQQAKLWYTRKELQQFRLDASAAIREILIKHPRWGRLLARISDVSQTVSPGEFAEEEDHESPMAYYRDNLALIYQESQSVLGLEQHLVSERRHILSSRRKAILLCEKQNAPRGMKNLCFRRISLPSRVYSREVALAQSAALQACVN